MPLMAFWIMPASVIGLFLAPFGLDHFMWPIAAHGVDVILWVATSVSSWKGAISLTPQWPVAALLVMTFGGLWLCLMRSPIRLAGLASVPVCALIVMSAQPPDMFIAASGRNAGLVDEHSDGTIAIGMYSTRRDRFSASVWGEAVGVDVVGFNATPIVYQIGDNTDVAACESRGCVSMLSNGVSVSMIEDPAMLAEDCARATLVVAFFPVSSRDWRHCSATLIDRGSIWRHGAHAL